MDEKISDIKARIHSRHVGAYEDWKEIKYGSAVKWPHSEHKGSLWRIFLKAMDQDQPTYEMRNWFSHDFGKRGGTVEEESARFKGLQEAYETLLPNLTELLSKLEERIQDETAWVGQSEVKARRNKEDQPEYTKDTMAVQLELAANHEESAAKWMQAGIDTAARSARIENGEDAWGDKDWVETGEEDEGWANNPEDAQAALSWTSLDEGVEDLWGSASGTDDDTSECDEDLPATSTQDDYDSGYESEFEENEELPTTVCKACGAATTSTLQYTAPLEQVGWN